MGVIPSPVAFVTAQPPPKTLPTATLPPLATPTPLPATRVPKRLPIDATAALGIWESDVASSAGFTRVVDIALGAGAADLRRSNPALLLLGARQMVYGATENITAARAINPRFFLQDAKGALALASDTREPLLNIRETVVRSQLSDDVANRVRQGGLDGMILEGLGNELIRTENAPVFTGTRVFTEDQRKDAALGLLQAVRAKVPDKLLLVGGYAFRDGSVFAARRAEAVEFASVGDGIVVSEFLRAPGVKSSQFRNETDWKRDVDFVSEISNDNRIVLVNTRITAADVTTDTAGQWLRFSVASFLLAKNGARAYFQFDAAGFSDLDRDPYLSVAVGSPTEAYSKNAVGIYRRAFSNGLVLVNPTGDAKKITLERAYITPAGSKFDVTTMPPNSGLVLLNP